MQRRDVLSKERDSWTARARIVVVYTRCTMVRMTVWAVSLSGSEATRYIAASLLSCPVRPPSSRSTKSSTRL